MHNQKPEAAAVALRALRQAVQAKDSNVFNRKPFHRKSTGENVWRTSQMAEAFMNAKIVKLKPRSSHAN